MPKRSHELKDEPSQKFCRTSNFQLKHREFLTDISGKRWKLGEAVGVGGFGQLYLASDNLEAELNSHSPYVAKVENHANGPLFVEVNCYLRIAKLAMVEEWKKRKNLKYLGMPHYVASGSHVHKGERYRFLILPRYDKDLEKVFDKENTLNLKTTLTISSQIIDVLEYIHSNGYIHSDIKASNIMVTHEQKTNMISTLRSKVRRVLSPKSHSPKITGKYKGLRPRRAINYCDDKKEDDFKINDQYWKRSSELALNNHQGDLRIALVDYGLASKYITPGGEHKPFCVDERKAHAGTILFCSRDAHKGMASRRSDLESLGYNVLFWLTGDLPWSKHREDPETVNAMKERAFSNPKLFLSTYFEQYPKFLLDYFQFIQKLKFQEKPDYSYCKQLFTRSLYEINQNNAKPKRRQLGNMRPVQYRILCTPTRINIPVKPLLRRQMKKSGIKTNLCWSKILQDPEVILKQSKEKKYPDHSDIGCVSDLDISRLNPTYAMIDVYNKCKERADSSPTYKEDNCLDHIEGYTPAMMSVARRMWEREEFERRESERMADHLSKSNKSMRKCVSGTGQRRKKQESRVRSPLLTRTSKCAMIVKKEPTGSSRKLRCAFSRKTYSLRG